MPEESKPTSRRVDFESVYEGEAVNGGGMNVRDLAPSLLALSVLIDQASALLYGSEKPVATQFKAGKQSSFAAQLLLEATWLQDEGTMFDSSEQGALQRLIDILWGDAADSGLKGLFQLIKFLKGQPMSRISFEQTAAGTVIVFNRDDEQLTTSRVAFQMSLDSKARAEAQKVVKPLEKPGIDSFYIAVEGKPKGEVITKDDLAYFLPEQIESEPEALEELIQLVKADVSNPKVKWRFLSPNFGRFSALISDTEFIQQFQSGTIRVGHNDALRVQLIRRRVVSGDRTRFDYELRKVVAYYPGGAASAQLPLTDAT